MKFPHLGLVKVLNLFCFLGHGSTLASQYGQNRSLRLLQVLLTPFQDMLSIPMNFYFCSRDFLFFLEYVPHPLPSSSAQSFLLQEGFLHSPKEH